MADPNPEPSGVGTRQPIPRHALASEAFDLADDVREHAGRGGARGRGPVVCRVAP